MQSFSEKNLGRIFWLFVILHTLIWTITPVFVRHALSDDFIEAVTWGQQFAFGYDKNPWLPGTLAHLGILLGGQSGIGIYFIQCLFVSLGFYAIWRLMLACSRPAYALIAVMMYEACAYYSIDLQTYNDNYILMGLLPLATWLFYRAIQTDRWRDWLAGSAMTALAMMAKYDTGLFALSVAVYLLLHPKRRHWLTSIRTYTALVLFILILLPNMLWLYQHHFQPLQYAFAERAGFSQHDWQDLIKCNLKFLCEAILAFLPTLILARFATVSRKKTDTVSKNSARQHDDLLYLFLTGFGPILLLFLMGFSMRFILHREWGNTFIGLWGSFVLLKWQPAVTATSLRRFVIAVFVIMLVMPAGYLMISFHKDTGNYPGREIARMATDTWHRYYKTRLRYVAGDRYIAGYVALHSRDKPAVWMEWNVNASAWIDVHELKCRGALFIQDSGHTRQNFYRGMRFPDAVRNAFPELRVLKPVRIPWQRNHLHQPDLKVLMGLLPPNQKICRKKRE